MARRSWRKLDGILLTALEGLAGVAALAFFYLVLVSAGTLAPQLTVGCRASGS
jgi:hypothetical protein